LGTEFEIQKDKYSISRSHPFHRPSTQSRYITFASIIICVFIGAIIYSKFSNHATNNTPQATTAASNTSQFAITQINTLSSSTTINSSNKKIVSKRDAAAIDQLKSINLAINDNLAKLSEQNKIPWNKRDFTTYKTILTDGIMICENGLNTISVLNIPSTFDQLLQDTKDILINAKAAYTHYLNYVNYNNTSEIDVGNRYMQVINQKSQNFIQDLTNILRENNYSYSFYENTLIYSVEK
jgi:hypothetical protein